MESLAQPKVYPAAWRLLPADPLKSGSDGNPNRSALADAERTGKMRLRHAARLRIGRGGQDAVSGLHTEELTMHCMGTPSVSPSA